MPRKIEKDFRFSHHEYKLLWNFLEERELMLHYCIQIHHGNTSKYRLFIQKNRLPRSFQASKMGTSTNITWHDSTVSQNDRWKLAGHRGAIVWFTGLSGAGKSSIANAVESSLNRDREIRTYLLDGDNIRYVGLCRLWC